VSSMKQNETFLGRNVCPKCRGSAIEHSRIFPVQRRYWRCIECGREFEHPTPIGGRYVDSVVLFVGDEQEIASSMVSAIRERAMAKRFLRFKMMPERLQTEPDGVLFTWNEDEFYPR